MDSPIENLLSTNVEPLNANDPGLIVQGIHIYWTKYQYWKTHSFKSENKLEVGLQYGICFLNIWNT